MTPEQITQQVEAHKSQVAVPPGMFEFVSGEAQEVSYKSLPYPGCVPRS